MFTISVSDIVGDARKLEGFPNNCFNCIIDKGLFDSLLCSELDNILSAKQYLREMYRMLKPGGYFIMVSHSSPDTRLGYLRKGAKWQVEHTTIGKFNIFTIIPYCFLVMLRKCYV